jgi:tetratricopeptide (TPR) repeat protein
MPNSRSLRLLATAALLAAPLGLGGCSLHSQAGAPSTVAAAAAAAVEAPVAVSSDLAEAPAGWGPVEPPPDQPVDPSDDLALGKRAFAETNYGLAEQHFRRAVEKSSGNRGTDAEAWLGLAASYDRLRRFDLADRAYKQAIAVWGPTAEILNNQGYSYLLRGDHRNARITLLKASSKEPGNPFILNNLAALEMSEGRAKRVN